MNVSDPLDDTLEYNQTGLVSGDDSVAIKTLMAIHDLGSNDGLESGCYLGRLLDALGEMGIRAGDWPSMCTVLPTQSLPAHGVVALSHGEYHPGHSGYLPD